MEKWKFWDISHLQHVLCNPMSLYRFNQFTDLIPLKPGSRILEIAMGKGEFIIQLAEKYGAAGIGVDLSPFVVEHANARKAERVPDADLEFIEMDGADYKAEEPEFFDLTACIGASWTYGGYKGTLEYLNANTKPGGWVVVGEPYWIQDPCEEYLAASEVKRDDIGTHHGNVAVAEALGLGLVYTLVSSQQEWDRYEGLTWYSTERYIREHPDDPDNDELFRRVRKFRESYLRWGRDALGWAVYLFAKPL